jgi:plasmid stabilization system protein ParE
MQVRISLDVRAELAAIAEYHVLNSDEGETERLVRDLVTTMRKLGKSPYHRRTSDDLPDRFRRVVSGYYVIYYEVDQQTKTVYVYEVRHGARKPLKPATHRRLASRAHRDSFEL